MKTKKFWLVLLTVLSVICMAFAVAGCDNQQDVGPVGPNTHERPKHEHTFTEWEIVTPVAECSDEDGLRRRHCTDPECSTPGGYVEEEVIPAIGHDKEIVPRQEPTCLAAGWNEYWVCKKCKASNRDEQVIEALGHDMQTVAAQEATCYQEGWSEYKKCSRCGLEEGEKNLQPMLEHNFQQRGDGFYCEMCNKPRLDDTENLTYKLSEDGTYYIVTGYTKDEDGNILDESGEVYELQNKNNLELDEDEDLCEVTTDADGNEVYTKLEQNKMMTLVIPKSHTGEDGKELPVYEIASDAFISCNFITIVATGDSVKTIGTNAFRECQNLKEVTLGPLTETVGIAAFAYSAIRSLEFPRKVSSIGMLVVAYCRNLVSLSVDRHNNRIYSENNCVLWRQGTEDFKDQIIIGCAGSTIPDGAKSIASWAFGMCTNLKEIDLKNVKTVGSSAFMLCTNLESVTMSDECQFIETSAFYACSSLKQLHLGAGLTRIGNSAFANCYKLLRISYNGTETMFRSSSFIRGEHWDCNDGLYDESGNRVEGKDDEDAVWTRRSYFIELRNGQYLKASGNGYEQCTEEEANGTTGE